MPVNVADPIDGVFYRASSLLYYPTILASIGARKAAGRFNRHGFSALYLALEPETALAEYWNGDVCPVVVAPVAFKSINLVDLRGDITGMSADWQDWRSDWKAAQEGHEAGDAAADCASWRCFDDVVRRRLNGVVYPSTKRGGGTNVVLFPEHATAGTFDFSVVDPYQHIAKVNPPDVT